MNSKQILDPCCGSKMFWFDKTNTNTVYGDKRRESMILCDGRKLEVNPSIILDFRKLPYKDRKFNLVIFDPPHLINVGKNSWLRKKYGCLETKSWEDDLTKGFSECWRVLNEGGTFIFKWNETQIKIKDVLKLFPIKPLLGQRTTHNLKTHWFVFYKTQPKGE